MSRARLAFVALLAVGVTSVGYVVDVAGAASDAPLGPGVVTVPMRIEHSRFSVDEVTVRAGTVIRFVVTNDDPILHELVVGGPAVHARHRNGSERLHPPVPGEVSVAPGERALTFFELDVPGTVTFACHLPGHEAYGMVGEVHVVR